jgi:RHS repeat-associated protein
VAGNGSAGYSGDGGSAPAARVNFPLDVAVGPDGSLFIADQWSHTIRRVNSTLPGSSLNGFVIPAEDGGELYVFDSRGRHLRTLDALTGAVRYQFGYDGAGRLAQVADRAGLVTRIERDAGGNPTAIVGPYGQRTTFSLDAQGYLASLTNPAGETTQFAYTPGGLLTRLTDPRGGVHNFTYDAAGRLTRDTNPAGGFIALARLFSTNGFTVTLGNALSVTTTYGVERLPAGDEGRVRIRAGGLRTETLIGANGTRAWHFPDGATQTVTLGPDPRWGMQAPPAKSQIIRTPGGLVSTIATTRSVNLADPNNALSLITLTDMVSFNGRTYTSIYDAASRTFLNTTPTGRQSTITLDALERVVQEQAANLHPDNYAYDADGRLASITQGSGAEARTLTFGYNSAGYLQTLTDSLGRTVSFNYDLAGRVTQQTLPGGRAIGFGYDANGNLTSITPPGRPAHAFTYTPVDLMETYSPPSVPGAGNNLTQYLYNAAQQLTRITRPDSQTIDFDYDSAGRLSTMTLPRGPLTYAYHPATGNLITITAPGGITLSYTYDGLLLTNSAWSGPINGSVSRAYDTDFRLTSLSVNNANPITLRYDADSLLTQAGALTLSRDPQNGLLTGTTLGNVTDTWSYNGIGEPASYSAAYAGAPMYAVQYGRDNLGRILTKTETISGLTQVYGYRYDVAGRLASVRLNSAPVATYTYDLNGNRLSYTNASSTSAGIYDNQDRLLQYGTTTYTYTANGELLSKTTGGQTTTYQYDQLANLLSVSLPDGTQIEYLIEGQNRRMGKRVNDALVQGFLYQDGLKPIAELDGSDNIVSRFVYGSQVNIPDYMVKGGVTYRIIADPLGSPRLVINTTTGQIVQRLDYDEFGNITMDTNPGFQPFGFAGGLYDPDTRLVRFGARDYDAETGRWTTKDPILFQSSDANLYAYVLNNPTTRVDPSGLDSKSRGYICGPCRDPKQAALEAVVKEMIQRVELDAYCRSGGVCISKLPRGQVSYEEFWRIVNGLSNGVQNYHAGWEGEPPEPIHDPTDEPVAPVLPPPGPTWIPPRCR